ncbi:MAG: hypothetical protein AMK72_14090 [Planctomycetes bacterium SM23_25]|nr:MAG: hypothetical protein AMK72_14090 [Planctomycetes bacterium SM23_25]
MARDPGSIGLGALPLGGARAADDAEAGGQDRLGGRVEVLRPPRHDDQPQPRIQAADLLVGHQQRLLFARPGAAGHEDRFARLDLHVAGQVLGAGDVVGEDNAVVFHLAGDADAVGIGPKACEAVAVEFGLDADGGARIEHRLHDGPDTPVAARAALGHADVDANDGYVAPGRHEEEVGPPFRFDLDDGRRFDPLEGPPDARRP